MKFAPILLGAELRGGNDTAMTIFKIPVFGAYLAPLIYVIAPPLIAASAFTAVASKIGLSQSTAMTCTLLFLATSLICWERCLRRWNVSFTLIILFFIWIPTRTLFHLLAVLLLLSAFLGR